MSTCTPSLRETTTERKKTKNTQPTVGTSSRLATALAKKKKQYKSMETTDSWFARGILNWQNIVPPHPLNRMSDFESMPSDRCLFSWQDKKPQCAHVTTTMKRKMMMQAWTQCWMIGERSLRVLCRLISTRRHPLLLVRQRLTPSPLKMRSTHF